MDARREGNGFVLRAAGGWGEVFGVPDETEPEERGPFPALPVPAARWGGSRKAGARASRTEAVLWTAGGMPAIASVTSRSEGPRCREEGEYWADGLLPPHRPAGRVSPPPGDGGDAGPGEGPWRWTWGRGWVPLAQLLAEHTAGEGGDLESARALALEYPDLATPALLASWVAAAPGWAIADEAARALVRRHPDLARPAALVGAGLLSPEQATRAAPLLEDAWARALGGDTQAGR